MNINAQGDPTKVADHVQEAVSLEAQGYAHLVSVRMSPPGQPEVMYTLTPQKTVVWQGYTWENYGVGITEYKRDASGEVNRPKLTLFNPNGIFSAFVHNRWMDGAEVVRYRVLKNHLSANINSYLRHTWRVGKVVSLNKTMVVCELRGVLDWQFFVLPGRAYYPPEFPSVSG